LHHFRGRGNRPHLPSMSRTAGRLGYSRRMTHRRTRIVAAVGVALLGLIVGQLAWAQTQAPPTPSPLSTLAGPLYDQLAALKGMASPGAPPPIMIKSRDETRRFIQQEMDRRYPSGRLESERKGMVAWGLIPADYDLRRLLVDLMEEQIAAYY